ncbi:reverse transcriptase domain-containing protein [Tanacetum coccineum]
MPFGLKNAGATYRCLVDKAFQKQIGRNLEVYVDDLVIKSHTEHEIIRDIEKTFKTLREINMKLKPKKSEAAFKEMKKLIAELPTLTAPMEKEELIVYLAAAREAILSRLEVVGRLQKWSIELGEYDIQYIPSTSVKGQILADFIVERLEDDPLYTSMEAEEELPDPFDATNNEAEYEALIAVLRIAEQMGVKNLQTNVDSHLVANQVNGSYIAKEPGMIQYQEKVKTLSISFKKFSIKQVPRSENKKADALSKIASTGSAHLTKHVLVEELKEKSISEAEVLAVMEEEGDT